MADPRVVDYIKSETARGVPLESVKQALISHGWREFEVEEAVREALGTKPAFRPVERSASSEKKSSKIIAAVIIAAVASVAAYYFIFFQGIDIVKNQDMFSGAGEDKQKTNDIQAESSPGGILDCGSDIDCFIAASESCQQAKAIHKTTISAFGVKQETTSYLEIKGMESGKCILYIRTEKIDLEFPPQTPQELIEDQRRVYSKLEGKDGTCKFEIDDLAPVLQKWKGGTFSSNDWDVAECSGSFFEGGLPQQ